MLLFLAEHMADLFLLLCGVGFVIYWIAERAQPRATEMNEFWSQPIKSRRIAAFFRWFERNEEWFPQVAIFAVVIGWLAAAMVGC